MKEVRGLTLKIQKLEKELEQEMPGETGKQLGGPEWGAKCPRKEQEGERGEAGNTCYVGLRVQHKGFAFCPDWSCAGF